MLKAVRLGSLMDIVELLVDESEQGKWKFLTRAILKRCEIC